MILAWVFKMLLKPILRKVLARGGGGGGAAAAASTLPGGSY